MNHTSAFVQVHHFKWVAGVIERLASRVAKYRFGEWKLLHPGSVLESEKVLEYFTTNNSQINCLSDPRCMFARAGLAFSDYVHWDMVTELIKGPAGIAKSKPGSVL